MTSGQPRPSAGDVGLLIGLVVVSLTIFLGMPFLILTGVARRTAGIVAATSAVTLVLAFLGAAIGHVIAKPRNRP